METLRDTALEYLKQQDFAAAIDYLNRQPDPLAACSAYADLVRHLYWQQKDLPGVVMMAQAGIQYGTAAAEEIGPEDSDPWKELLSIVKGLAYDLGSFTWPGWDEPGITITPADLNTGREAAKTNLR